MDTTVAAKTTGDLLQELKDTAHIRDYIKTNEPAFVATDFAKELKRLFEGQGRNKAEIAREAGISDIYLYQIFSGKRVPTRDRLICICMGMHLPVEDAQRLFRLCGHAQLYARDRRDAVILHGLLHSKSIQEVNAELFSGGLDPLL